MGWEDPLEKEIVARDGVSREVPCSALKGETVPDSLPATPNNTTREAEMGVTWPPAKGCWQPPEAKRGKNQILPQNL